MRHLVAGDFQVSTWSGGRTVQIAIAPEGATYADREFLWRVSSATVELDESDFTPLPDYDRWIMPLSGTMRLTHNSGEAVTLAPHEAHFFSGADKTHCQGRCTDFNLMLRRGRARGRIFALTEDAELSGEGTKILYCADGSVTVGEISLKKGEAVLLNEGERGSLFLAPGGRAVMALIQTKE